MPAGDADVSIAADFVSCRTIKMKMRVNRRSGNACDEQGFNQGRYGISGRRIAHTMSCVCQPDDRLIPYGCHSHP